MRDRTTTFKRETLARFNTLGTGRGCHALLLTISAMPAFFLALENQRDLRQHELLVAVSASALALALLSVLTRLYPRAATLALTLVALFAIPQTWFVLAYGWPFDSNTLSLVAETNIAEASDFVASIAWWTWLLALVPIVLTVPLFLAAPRKYSPEQRASQRRLLSLIATGLAFLSISASWMAEGGAPAVPDDTFPAAPRGYALALRAAYPASLPVLAWDYHQDRTSLSHAVERNRSFSFGATRARSTDARRIYVLIIGETARGDHLELNGYHRETNPRLSAFPELLSFTRMYSRSTFTRLSVPVILSRKPPESESATFHESSIIAAFREAGFRTAWISLQAPLGYHESPTSVHAAEADEVTFLNPVDYRSSGQHDDAAIPAVQDFISRTSQEDLFIVVHLLGSHFRYSDRYPGSFAQFVPDKREERPLRLFAMDDRTHLLNSYDNSVLFTDHVLASLIELLKSSPEAESWLMYVSDHGEALFDDCRNLSGHGMQSKATHSVAALFWPSEVFSAGQPEQVANLRSNRHLLTSTAMLFETLASAGGINIPKPRENNDLTKQTLRTPSEVAEIEKLDADACTTPTAVTLTGAPVMDIADDSSS